MPSSLPSDPNWGHKGAQRKKVERNSGGGCQSINNAS